MAESDSLGRRVSEETSESQRLKRENAFLRAEAAEARRKQPSKQDQEDVARGKAEREAQAHGFGSAELMNDPRYWGAPSEVLAGGEAPVETPATVYGQALDELPTAQRDAIVTACGGDLEKACRAAALIEAERSR